ncbi:hypothetical protein K503DRAFT_372031 [Rhizopogon vinicolor AM-OR11-026]|uniref:Uncharacterized protein n=1 Tax=Rhizopogon vinicolor AM-OR11-026 TaxID=1314800 RepID=A0A1B7MRZ0_9AGAM|nr:hypothetical protein K503DRAFT_372031 [Rhizopogon vinicolor AM-OR11-026]
MNLRCGSDWATIAKFFRYHRRRFAPISRGCVLSLHFNVLSATGESPGYMFCLRSHHARWILPQQSLISSVFPYIEPRIIPSAYPIYHTETMRVSFLVIIPAFTASLSVSACIEYDNPCLDNSDCCSDLYCDDSYCVG